MQLDTVKNYLDVTWTDSGTDTKLTGILSRAESLLESYAGTELDFTDETTLEAQLLLDCCRYMWYNVIEDFKANYSQELIMLRARRKAAVSDEEQ